jgi:phosphopentomutase
LPEATILDRLSAAGIPVITVGKLDDIFDRRGITQSVHVENNRDAQRAVLELAQTGQGGLIFANLIDFDMLYGHRRDASGYAKALEQTDLFLAELTPLLKAGDVLIITADHGNDPTYKGTDHTREFAPLLVYRPGVPGGSLGIRRGYYDIAQSLATFFRLASMPRGRSFL